MKHRLALILALSIGLRNNPAIALGPIGPAAPRPQAVQLDLEKPFHTRSPWRLVVTEGAPVKDYGDNDAPGALTLCLHKGPTGPCVPDPVTPPPWVATPGDITAWAPHYLLDARPVYPLGPKAAPLLLIVTGSLNAGDGDQIVATQLIRYDAGSDAFRRIYAKTTGHNNNQEVRFVTSGPLRGSVISAEPQQHRPYGFWIEVNQLTAAGLYRQVLRYGSATRYNDGNGLAVIDSEMPNIEKRLGLWKSGDPLPTPQLSGGKPCPKPALRHSELWCE
ncbi:MAG TPA: hypothetical protein VHC39_11255 [Rhizomicrobium sp.]|nr:hypothetical protein [Rhizomicrobium sp.]